MKPRYLHSSLFRVLSIVLSIIFLWGFGISLLVVTLNMGIGFSDNNADFRSEFLNMTERNEYSMLQSYLEMTLHSQLQANLTASSSEINLDSSEILVESDPYFTGLEQNLHTFETHFDPENTNFRFAAMDMDGRLLLTNDPLYGEDAPLLASNVHTEELFLEHRSYQILKHFEKPAEAFNEIVYGDPSEFLDSPEDFQLWYFSNDLVDAVYHDGLSVYSYDDPYTDYLFFSSEEEAKQFDFSSAYGSLCTWEIAASAAVRQELADDDELQEIYEKSLREGILEPENIDIAADSAHSVVVRVIAYASTDELEIPLEKYYEMKQSGMEVYAVDGNLESVLVAGLDITIRAERTETAPYYIRTYLPEDLEIRDTIRTNYAVYSLLFRNAEWSVILMFLLLVLTVLATISMCTAAGHSDGTERIDVPRVHTIAYEFFWMLPPLSAVASWIVLATLNAIGSSYRIIALFCIGMILCIAACCILWLYTTAVRSKAGTFWSSFGTVQLFRRFFGMFRNRTFTCIALVVYAVFLFVSNVWLLQQWSLLVLPVIGIDLLTLLAIIYCVYAYFELHRHVKEMETGDFTPASHPIPLGADFAEFDSALNDITDRVGEIVAQQTRAEHLRTELITNVSHDLKTPLTSIVNYVDLLSREPMQTDTAAEYLEVLKRQAARLKKLTIDLVDASKASTGNLNVELVPTDLQVLIAQFAGEYEEQLAAKSLSLILNIPEEPLMILADGRQIGRVFDNLLNNVCKYALEGTRVYLDLREEENCAVISLKNISAQPLNVSPDELMERFVRGDDSRHTEGSGLGLSIARDLTGLQNGMLQLSTDGDLFKAYLTFPLLVFPPDDLPEAL